MALSSQVLVERLFVEHGRALRAFLSRRIHRHADAADLEQEVYVRMLRVVNTRAIRDPEAYLFAVAANLAKEKTTRGRVRRETTNVDNPEIQAQLSELPDLDGDLDTANRIKRLRKVLLQLSPRCRAAVVLQYGHDLTYAQIGQRIGVSPHMVKKYLSQALVHCRQRMGTRG